MQRESLCLMFESYQQKLTVFPFDNLTQSQPYFIHKRNPFDL